MSEAISLAKEYLGIRYGAWNGYNIPRNDSTPFYAGHGEPPPYGHIRQQGISCTGLTNLIRRHYGLTVPGVDDPLEAYPGGTGAWWRFLKPALSPFREGQDYPVGSVLFRPYCDFDDQGHIAIVVGPNTVIHSFPEAGVAITPILMGYYATVAPPAAWLPQATKVDVGAHRWA
jgi:hypothetical protein